MRATGSREATLLSPPSFDANGLRSRCLRLPKDLGRQHDGVDGDPFLLYRTGSGKYSFVPPADSTVEPPRKSLRGVHGTPLNEVWSTISCEVSALVG